jgi:hypothetical protein
MLSLCGLPLGTFSVTQNGSGESFLTSVARRAGTTLLVQLSKLFSDFKSQQPPKQPPEQNEEGHLLGGLYNLMILMVLWLLR